jgi:TPR repeat protein
MAHQENPRIHAGRKEKEKVNQSEAYQNYFNGKDFFFGYKCKKDYGKAFKLLFPAASFGIQHAQNLIGQCYFYGLGVNKSEKKAFNWYRKAALNNSKFPKIINYVGIALCNLAIMYDLGEGISENPKLAFKYLKKSAEMGDIEAQCNLGLFYFQGRGTRKNFVLAIKWTSKAAKKGDSLAQYNLGLAFKNGEGVLRSNRYAKLWFKKAAKAGHKKAAKELLNMLS